MQTADIINALFEGSAAFFILNHCRVLLRERAVAGVSTLSTGFFFVWGLWNVFYYPHLGQTFSFFAGIAVVIANSIWLYLQMHFREEQRLDRLQQ